MRVQIRIRVVSPASHAWPPRSPVKSSYWTTMDTQTYRTKGDLCGIIYSTCMHRVCVCAVTANDTSERVCHLCTVFTLLYALCRPRGVIDEPCFYKLWSAALSDSSTLLSWLSCVRSITRRASCYAQILFCFCWNGVLEIVDGTNQDWVNLHVYLL